MSGSMLKVIPAFAGMTDQLKVHIAPFIRLAFSPNVT
jgi:hypothetical protein